MDSPQVPVTKVELKEEPQPQAEEELEYQKILKEHGGIESNIPINSRYWKIRP